MHTFGLTRLSLANLERLFRAVHRGTLTYPLTRHQLLLMGFGAEAEHSDLLFGLDERGVRAVLTAAIAERRTSEKKR